MLIGGYMRTKAGYMRMPSASTLFETRIQQLQERLVAPAAIPISPFKCRRLNEGPSTEHCFAELLLQHRDRAQQAKLDRQREITALHADPFDVVLPGGIWAVTML